MPNAALPHMSRCVCLQCLEHLRRAFGTRVYNDVSMIGPYIYCIKSPITEMASFLYCCFNRIPHFCTEEHRRISKVCLGGRMPSGVRRDSGRTKYVITSIHRAPLVTVKPRAMATERNQKCQRNFGVVPHVFTGLRVPITSLPTA